VESLEDRQLLTVFMPPANAGDGSPNSLRADIMLANGNSQNNTIILQSGMYLLTIPNTAGQENNAAQGDLDLTSAGYTLTIQGQGAGKTIIEGGGLDRVFQVMPNVSVVIKYLTIQGGVAQDSGDAGAVPGSTEISEGGGIFNSGTLELGGVVVQNCTAAGDAGSDGVAGAASGGEGEFVYGGGIFNIGTLTIDQCVIQDNTAQGGQGGNGSTASDNSGSGGQGNDGNGGGIYSEGTLNINQSTIAGNIAIGGAGGDGGTNTTGIGPSGGDGGYGDGGGLYLYGNQTQVKIVDSTIAGNRAVAGVGGRGGKGGSDPNGSGYNGGQGGYGEFADGGGILAYCDFELDNCTIAGNKAVGADSGQGGLGGSGAMPGLPGPGNTEPPVGGGIDEKGPAFNSISTIIALNKIVPDGQTAEPDDVDGPFGSVSNTLLGYGIGATGIIGGVDGNIVGGNPGLGRLQNNGGPTPTMALLPGSPAIDAGANPLGLTTDQRGYGPRVVGAAADIGAYELGATAPQGGGGATGVVPIEATVIKVKGHKEVRGIDPATGAVKFTVFPFGKAYRGQFVITTADVNGDGIADLIVRRPRGHHKFITKVFSGTNGTPLPSSLA
jgi:hypothetical protein